MQKEKQLLLRTLVSMSIILLTGWVGQIQAEDQYPNRPIEVINVFGPGGSTDLTGRVLATYLKEKWGVPVNIVSKPGGNTVPAGLEVFSSKPDGYTLLNDGQASAVLVVVAVKNLPFKIMDRTFIGMYSYNPLVFVVPSTSPFKSLKDLEMECKKNPEKFTWSSLGGAGNQDLGTRQFLKAIGVDVLKTKPVMCQSGTQTVALAAGGHVVLGSGGTSAVLPAVKGGTVRALAITGDKRFPDLPDVPTTVELGYPTITSMNWNCISGPPKLPKNIVDLWEKAFEDISKNQDFHSKQRNVGAVPFYLNASATKERVRREIEEAKELWDLK